MVLIHGILDFINDKILCLFFCMMICILLVGCKGTQEMSENVNSDQRYYHIYHGENDDDRWNYYYDLFDLDGNVIKHECTYMNEPKIEMIDTDILKITVQAGTGRWTTYSYYYDISNNTLSPVYYYPLGEKSHLAAFLSDGRINICEMFQKQVCYKQIVIPEELQQFEEPVDSVLFSEDLKQVTIVYTTGESDTINL